jgi:hypothetical protein
MKLAITGLLFLTSIQTTLAGDFKGDLRFRAERIDQKGKDVRLRERIRARFGFYGQADERFDYGIRLISGSSDPVSANQTFDDSFSSKSINLDRAYLKWTCPLTGSKAYIGKMSNPFAIPGKSPLIWDSDLSPEGIALQMSKWGAFLNLGRHWLDERSGTADAFLHGAQIGYGREVGPIKLMFGAAYFDYVSVKDQTVYDPTESVTANKSSAGNSTTAANAYLYDYNLTEIFMEISATEMPFTVYLDYVKNSEAVSDDMGYLAGFTAGKKFSIDYNYRRLEKDAVLGAFTNSNFAGGGTNGIGHFVGLAWKATEKSKLGLNHYFNKTAVKNGNDYHRTQLDLSLKF